MILKDKNDRFILFDANIHQKEEVITHITSSLGYHDRMLPKKIELFKLDGTSIGLFEVPEGIRKAFNYGTFSNLSMRCII